MNKKQRPTEKSEYDIQAETFLKKHGITMSTVFLYHGPHFEGEKDNRDVYMINFAKLGKPSFIVPKFGQCQAESRNYYRETKPGLNTSLRYISTPNFYDPTLKQVEVKTPSAYTVLAALTKSDPGSFEDFCSEYGCDTDSRKAEQTWRAVVSEWKAVKHFFTPEQITELQEIN